MSNSNIIEWSQVIGLLQDILNINEVQSLDSLLTKEKSTNEQKDKVKLLELLERIQSNDNNTSAFQSVDDDEQIETSLRLLQDHLQNIIKSQKLLDSMTLKLSKIIETSSITQSQTSIYKNSNSSSSSSSSNNSNSSGNVNVNVNVNGKQYWTSAYNPVGLIPLHSEVAYKPKQKNSADEEWFQCIVIKISNDGLKYEVQDPEPDEMGNSGKIFKCNWKEIIPIPSSRVKSSMKPYPMGTKVLARYPETTTFYPAVVSRENRKDTKICKLRFDGEEEVNKETEVDRRFVLPFPTISAFPVNNAKRS